MSWCFVVLFGFWFVLKEIGENLSDFGVYLVSGIVVLGLILVLFGALWHNCLRKGSDQSNFVSIFRFCQSVADLYTDLLFAIILYYDDDVQDNYVYLFYICAASVILPYFASCIMGVYWIARWRVSQTAGKRLTGYFKSYDVFIYAMTTLAGFYTTIDLCRSKLFFLDIFHLQLKSSETTSLKNLRFFNIVIFENVCLSFFFPFSFLCMHCVCIFVFLSWIDSAICSAGDLLTD